ncbi:probable inactive tRNA-specific adenosine deaminase-like protein 3 isoform X2 [Venturia canescens]|nr:probable inactive tRNA-specific adenosine deaminase-like protein 3 isoform X2 [Venturia canescens]XP_043288239.1 probable inactive tRNA-specific adenosine deaminase-like protein 3 isoform X2 [Venturia canescens]XP_043288240.1 probable inactive tRNA-specific adenosine deaminase-like protein 3 isoform X2 [Venturia canescens]
MSKEVPKAVVAEELWRENVGVADAWIGKLRDARQISRILGRVAKTLPPMGHLKRCSEKRLLLGFAVAPSPSHDDVANDERKAFTREEMLKLLREADLDICLFENGAIEIIGVPAVAARTRAQARRVSEIWPLNFHPDPHLESILDGTCFDERQIEAIDRCTKVCAEVALLGGPRGTKECQGSAVVYDPKSDKVVALAASRTDLHPLWHAAIVAIDLVARFGSGGAYDFSKHLSNSEESKRPRIDNTGQHFPLAFPQALRTMARRFTYDDGKPPFYTYLCTDYWIFLLTEPCSLCAMALLHSRFSNVFYGVPNSSRGVLGSRTLLHDLPGLNHRYRVWKGIRSDECFAAFREIQKNVAVSE